MNKSLKRFKDNFEMDKSLDNTFEPKLEEWGLGGNFDNGQSKEEKEK